ncbi:MAG: Uma2 family endonuclease [Anaerolineae bacterium]|nr:Uma2 family endonuclease [Anaerolineae bacterium]
MEKTIELARPAPAAAVIHYPESDGQPIGETDFHITVILYLRQALRHVFRQAEQIYVAANMLFYFEEGNPAAFRSPDVFVVKGIPRHNRRVYKLWEEKVAPCAIFEITSRSTRLEDLGTKRALYEMLGVQEYILFDPLDEYLSPRFQAFSLRGEYYQPMALLPDGTLRSQELDVILQPEGNFLRVIDPNTGEAVPTLDEAVDLAYMEAERARIWKQNALEWKQNALEWKQNALKPKGNALKPKGNALKWKQNALKWKQNALKPKLIEPMPPKPRWPGYGQNWPGCKGKI